jgi:hypothetical protein
MRATTALLFAALLGTAPAAVAQGPILVKGEGQDFTVSAEVKQKVIDNLLKELQASYVFPETAEKMAGAVRRRVKGKEHDKVTSGMEFARLLTTWLQEVSRDKLVAGGFQGQAPSRQRHLGAASQAAPG